MRIIGIAVIWIAEPLVQGIGFLGFIHNVIGGVSVFSGGVFVMESISVMIQFGWFKYTGGKRFFKMAPIHHHFEQLGWPETKVVFRFWLIGIVLAVLALVSLYCK